MSFQFNNMRSCHLGLSSLSDPNTPCHKLQWINEYYVQYSICTYSTSFALPSHLSGFKRFCLGVYSTVQYIYVHVKMFAVLQYPSWTHLRRPHVHYSETQNYWNFLTFCVAKHCARMHLHAALLSTEKLHTGMLPMLIFQLLSMACMRMRAPAGFLLLLTCTVYSAVNPICCAFWDVGAWA